MIAITTYKNLQAAQIQCKPGVLGPATSNANILFHGATRAQKPTCNFYPFHKEKIDFFAISGHRKIIVFSSFKMLSSILFGKCLYS